VLAFYIGLVIGVPIGFVICGLFIANEVKGA